MNPASSLYVRETCQSDSAAEVTTMAVGAGDLQYELKPLVRNKSGKGY